MAYNKKTWLARLGQGLNKFVFNGGSKVTLESAPDVVTQAGTPLSADNMNDLEQRIADEFSNQNDAIHAIIRTFNTDISMLAGTHGEYSVPAEDIPVSAKILGLAYRNYPSSEIMDVTWNFIKVTGHWIVSYNNPFGARTVSVSIYYAL